MTGVLFHAFSGSPHPALCGGHRPWEQLGKLSPGKAAPPWGLSWLETSLGAWLSGCLLGVCPLTRTHTHTHARAHTHGHPSSRATRTWVPSCTLRENGLAERHWLCKVRRSGSRQPCVRATPTGGLGTGTLAGAEPVGTGPELRAWGRPGLHIPMAPRVARPHSLVVQFRPGLGEVEPVQCLRPTGRKWKQLGLERWASALGLCTPGLTASPGQGLGDRGVGPEGRLCSPTWDL